MNLCYHTTESIELFAVLLNILQTLYPIFSFFIKSLTRLRALLRWFSCSIIFSNLFYFNFLINYRITVFLNTFLLKIKIFLFIFSIDFWNFIRIRLALSITLILINLFRRSHILNNIFFSLSSEHWWILWTYILSQFQFLYSIFFLNYLILILIVLLIIFLSICVLIAIHIFVNIIAQSFTILSYFFALTLKKLNLILRKIFTYH